ncbi:type 1 fimbrial protein [Xenorhabdus nematophila]|uniref:Type 1 fimbrial protein n=1 Tax=Xenorhabdus nematophila (strain ATCC 19061 / DSM 3370 / CCUG 14189 / LMG 1036 / NCIMB 9965 / AN6) TaxID=406817 RepID=D3VIW8_XENNA|nr:type 1 fimbrial protein [Xenorhabdus nematophila]CEE90253.1 conserved hypothetical protein; putative exported protein [Xenorhabdus nematophila str. Anatoliense]CEF32147.1 conserved hypothetical protein; putative exported protein [Xenorhabdus nematophila str. Websteri]AYA39899.1 type 1 fimbrial protein [Xenorhabdus nematophila]MBA0018468.1 type 1 fimbrial protein [Xenorhabdus nematophila]MCB4424802.1 type 1 fimbrial protein [Xenorhabdus nematophila]
MLRKMTTFLFISLSYPGMVYSLPTSSSGLIHFQGAIVDPPCQFNWEEEHIEMACWYDGEQLKQEKVIEYKKESKSPLSIEKNIGTKEVKWLGENKKLGLITVTYH